MQSSVFASSAPSRSRRRSAWRASVLGSWLVVAAALVPVDARAAEGDSRRQAAEALFQQGRDLLESGHAPEACAKFEASQALDEGLGTLLFLGECYEKVGKTASAWRAFSAAVEKAERQGDTRRGGLARIRVAALEPVLALLLVRASPQTRALAGLEVRRNGVVFDPLDLNRPLAIDPGDVVLEVTAPDYERWQTQLEIRPGPSNAVIDIPRLMGNDVRERNFGSDPDARRDEPLAPRAKPGGGLAPWAIALGAVGLAGVATGAYLGWDAVHTADDSRERRNCPLDDRCYAEGLKLRDDARSQAHLADVVTGSGAALLLGGVILYLVAPSASSATGSQGGAVSISAGAGAVDVRLGGSF